MYVKLICYIRLLQSFLKKKYFHSNFLFNQIPFICLNIRITLPTSFAACRQPRTWRVRSNLESTRFVQALVNLQTSNLQVRRISCQLPCCASTNTEFGDDLSVIKRALTSQVSTPAAHGILLIFNCVSALVRRFLTVPFLRLKLSLPTKKKAHRFMIKRHVDFIDILS